MVITIKFKTRFRPAQQMEWGVYPAHWMCEPTTFGYGAFLGNDRTELGAIADLKWKIETERKIQVDMVRE